MTQAAYNLMAKSRWVLTGTPIVNNLRDLQSHIKFLRLTGGLEQNDIFTGKSKAQDYPNLAYICVNILRES